MLIEKSSKLLNLFNAWCLLNCTRIRLYTLFLESEHSFFASINCDFLWEKLLCFESSHAFGKCNYLLPNKSISGQWTKVSIKWKFNFLNACYLFYCKWFNPKKKFFQYACNMQSKINKKNTKHLIFRWNVRLTVNCSLVFRSAFFQSPTDE